MSESSTKADYVAGLRSGLDELHKYQSRPPTPDANPLADVKALFESIPADLQASVLDKAIGKGIRRFRAAASLLAECQQTERVDNWITASLTHPDTERRDWMIQIVGNNKLVRFAECIARTVETDEQCRWFAVIAAGELQTENCCDSLVSLADSFGQEAIPASLIIALSRFSSPRVTPHLERVFRSHAEERDQVFAAWGLARQGHQEAIEYLVRKLDEPDSSTGSRRAAQALSDLYGWDIEWTPEAARKAKERWEESLHNKNA
jgi:HEAT repeat protein